MRIEIHPETKEEKKQMPKKVVVWQVIEFGIVGRYQGKPGIHPFSHLHVNDKYMLYGQLTELRERLKDGG